MKRILLSLLLAVSAPAADPPAGDFRFVVIGDTRPKFESEDFRIFAGLIDRINQRKPALVINLGDLIYGYGVLSKEKQWNKYEQTIRALEAPYHQLPGNHDIYSRAARRVYQQRFGRFYESFDYGGCHFVLLNNCEDGRWGHLGPAQLEWLRADLRQTAASRVFVFLHFPVWEPERVAPRYYEFWNRTLHPLFCASRVQAVFGGHFHSYGPSREFDGIRYFVTGGGGAELRPEYRKAGGEYHFLEVRTQGAGFDLRVHTEHGELSDAEADVLGGFEFAEKHSSRVGIEGQPADLTAGVQGSLALTNPYGEMLVGHAAWNLDPKSFQVDPPSMAVRLPPQGSTNFAFTLRALQDQAPLSALPWLAFDVTAGGRHHRFHRAVVILSRLTAAYRPSAPVLDGRLTEWDNLPWVPLGDAAAPADVRATHSEDRLVLAVRVPRVSPEVSEESGFPDALQLGFAERRSATDFSGDFLRVGFGGEGDAAGARDRTLHQRSVRTVPRIQSFCRAVGAASVFEIAIPTAMLRIGSTRQERGLVMSLAFPLPEGGPSSIEPPQPGANTFAYQARYGGGALVPVYFIQLLLEPKRKEQ